MAGIKIEKLSKTFNIKNRIVSALSDVTLNVEDGQFITVVGRSGSGKTTLLRVICGLEEKSSGTVRFIKNNKDESEVRVSMVFQEPRLMPWLTVEENMAFALRKQNTEVIERKVSQFMKLLGLTKFKDAYPFQISGGMAQRTALGRTLCYDPDVILMDEPLGALDALTRQVLQKEIVKLFTNQKKTVVFVTHDVDEAVILGQKVVVMEEGRIKEEISIDLPYPRNLADKTFFSYRQEILGKILGNQV